MESDLDVVLSIGVFGQTVCGTTEGSDLYEGLYIRWRVVAVDDGTDADKDVLLWSKGKEGLLTTNFVLNQPGDG